MSDLYCPIIHGGLQINLKKDHNDVYINQCCLRNDLQKSSDIDVWSSKTLIPLRDINKRNVWDSYCWICQGNELSGLESFRTGSIKKFSTGQYDLIGPKRLDLMFDIGCNLACRTCGPDLSTFWQRHLKENNLTFTTPIAESRADDMISILKNIDLSNLEMVVFCGGETLLGNGYWRVAEAIAELVPHSRDKVVISFQTNGTQRIHERYHKIIEKFKLVKLHISLDGIGERFEYLRWPAKWDNVVEIANFHRDNLPVNVMFLIEETISIFNLYYQKELDTWAKTNYSVNRLGDIVDHTKHMAYGFFSLNSLTQEYIDAISHTDLKHLINPNWSENPALIRRMVNEIKKFDSIRNQDWAKTFPEVASFYSRYI